MPNFKMILPEIEVKETYKSEIDETIMILIEFKEEDNIKDFLRKYKENKYVDLYVTGKHFKEDYISRKEMVEIKDIEVLAFSVNEKTALIKFHTFEYIEVTKIRKTKIKNMLNN